MYCHFCQTQIELSQTLGFREECPQCHSDLHVCKNCSFFDAKVYNECTETSAERVLEKEKANFCEYFKAATSPGKPTSDAAQNAKAALEALFKK